ncbi:CRISPR-associated ring nuclease Crn1 [Acidianus manzaensis]|uniref:CRISPR-associated protein n=1 Tax=Acidianus manzaensis TaxID=282676 RepID=A0A1W6K2Z3_9CREN|nr:CRISPR-associated ring nuclease Crn1 [Acidianus manzaensis]ARM76921.1 CRISPR-associated protein [Acidianus manzaensis]
MVKLVCTLGTSPGGIFETLGNLRKGNYEAENPIPVNIKEVYVIRTSDKAVDIAWKLVKAIFACCGEKDVTISDISLQITDITSNSDYELFMKEVSSRISKGDYVDFTGGRKAMSVAAAIAAKELNAHIVTTIIPQNEYNEIAQRAKGLKEEDIIAGGNRDCRVDFCSLTSKNARTILLQ